MHRTRVNWFFNFPCPITSCPQQMQTKVRTESGEYYKAETERVAMHNNELWGKASERVTMDDKVKPICIKPKQNSTNLIFKKSNMSSMRRKNKNNDENRNKMDKNATNK